MKLFLTSDIGGSYKENGTIKPCALYGSNHLSERIREHWPIEPKCLMISSDPENEEINDIYKTVYEEAFKISNLPFSGFDVCDRRNENKLADMLYDYDVILLAGGHVPTQNRFFSKIHLQELMKSYDGIVIGISAGTMNCADVVYAQPELDGEAIDPQYQRYLDGLNLTKINILPHFHDVKNLTVDGLRILEDISLPDSKIRPFYALTDGAYVFVADNKSILYGEAYLIKDGSIKKICETDESIKLV